MKYILQISLILGAAFWTFHESVAQTVEETQQDTVRAESDARKSVQVAFRKVAETDLLGGTSVVNVSDLIEKNYSIYSLDNMEAFVGGWTGNSIWGMDDYLVLVDGVPRDAGNVMPTEIEQITFLKSAAAVVLYGSRAAKGVVYISTKRGDLGPLRVRVRANTGYHVAKSYPKYLGSAEYMTLFNEALANDGQPASFSDEDIYHSASGENPYRYPDVNYYSSEFLKKAFNRTDVTAELSGGEKRARFYTNIGYIRQDDVFKFGEAKNNFIDRLNVRGNVDIKIHDKIDAFVNANATFYNAHTARSTGGSYWTEAATARPNRVAPLIPLSYIDQNDTEALDLVLGSSNIIDGKYFLAGTQADSRNIFADFYAAGQEKWTSRQFQFDAGMNFDLSSTVEGLSFHAQYGVDYATSYTTSFENSYAVYSPQWVNYNGEDVTTNFTRLNNDTKSGQQIISGSASRQTIAVSAFLNYAPTLSGSHHLSARLLVNGFQQTRSAEYHRVGNANLGAQVNYDFANKYYVDLAAALPHSAKLPEGNRKGFSPSVTLGWRMSRENFLAGSPTIDDLVLSVSGSIINTDLDIDGPDGQYFLSEAAYTQAEGDWWGWRDGASERATKSLRGSNDQLGFVKRKELSANVRTSLWEGLVKADASFFVNSMEGLIIQPSVVFPIYFSTFFPDASFMPYVNYNNHQRSGVDFNVNVNRQIGDVAVSVGLSGTYVRSKATRLNEDLEDDIPNRTGRPLDALWGLKSAGLFQSVEEIDNSPLPNFAARPMPGDIKYVDQNGDGVIDDRDEVYLGRGGWNGGPFSGGLNITANWKGFTFFVLGTGNFGAYAFKNSPYFWAFGNRKYSEVVRDRWTEETKETATYPRLTATNGANNFRNSDFWMFKTNWFNLARVQLTYELPSSLVERTFLRTASIYVSGSNLLTLSKEREILEMNVGAAPQTRFYNLGVRASF